jgi:hypothetical protein
VVAPRLGNVHDLEQQPHRRHPTPWQLFVLVLELGALGSLAIVADAAWELRLTRIGPDWLYLGIAFALFTLPLLAVFVAVRLRHAGAMIVPMLAVILPVIAWIILDILYATIQVSRR